MSNVEKTTNNVVQFPKTNTWTLAEIELARSRGEMAESVRVDIQDYFELLDLAELSILAKMQGRIKPEERE